MKFIYAILLSVSFTATSSAMRLSDIEEFATLTIASVAKLGDHKGEAEAGAEVQVLGRPTSPSDKTPRKMLFVRIVRGSCVGYELTIDEDMLTDFRETVEPTT